MLLSPGHSPRHLSSPSPSSLSEKSIQTPNTSSTPPAKNPSKNHAVLDEDSYVAAIEKIIERDFFPDIPKLRDRLDWLEAVRSGDPMQIRDAQLKIIERRSGKASEGKIRTPGSTFFRTTTPFEFDKTPTVASHDFGGVEESNDGSVDVALSLDEFFRRYTSEDNDSFCKIIEKVNRKRKERYGYLTEGGKEEEEEVGLIEDVKRNRITDGYGTSDQPPSTLEGWNYTAKNLLMYHPSDRGEVPLTLEERTERLKCLTKEINRPNTPEITSIYRMKLVRYFSNPTHFFYHFSLSQRLPISLYSSLETLKPSFSVTPNNTFHSLQPQSSPNTKSVYSLLSSTGSPSVSSQTPPISQNVDPLTICRNNNRYPICCNGLPRPHSLSRLISVSSSDASFTSSTSNGTTFSDKNGEFENLNGVGSDDSQLIKRDVDGFGSKIIRCDEDELTVLGELNEFDNLDSVGFDDSQLKKRKVDGVESIVTRKRLSKIIELIRSDEDDLESKLNLIGASLSVESITEIFGVLNLDKISGLRFFEWVRDRNRQLYYNADVCSLIIDNCGRLDNYETMICLLKGFKANRICLTEKAFGFLLVLGSNNASVRKSIERMIDVLSEAGGSCRASGIWALIKMFSTLDSFEMAKLVMEITERKVSYYNILVLEKCRKCHFEEALAMLEEMRQFGCEPNVKTYNYLLSSLCKFERLAEACSVLEEVQEKGCHPDVLTFEIFIYYSCRLGKMDSAAQFLDQMVSADLEPRATTHAAFIKGYFNLGKYKEAYKYVLDASVKYKLSSSKNYSLLASLHQKEGHLNAAINILIEMMGKGHKPNFSVYIRILKQLDKPGKERCLARDLLRRFSRFRPK